MHALDTRALYEQPITDDGHQPDDMDDDLFVAARVAITAAGHTTWQTIHDDPATVTQRVDWPIADAEHLLDLIDPDPETRVNTPDSVETRTNPHGWPPPEAHTTPSSSAAAGGGQDWLRVGSVRSARRRDRSQTALSPLLATSHPRQAPCSAAS